MLGDFVQHQVSKRLGYQDPPVRTKFSLTSCARLGQHEAMSQPAQPSVNISLKPDYREGYANSVQVRVSLWDFFLQFGLLGTQTPEQVQIEAIQGIYLSPQQAKALHLVLGENLAQYENAFGPIKIDANQARSQAVQ